MIRNFQFRKLYSSVVSRNGKTIVVNFRDLANYQFKNLNYFGTSAPGTPSDVGEVGHIHFKNAGRPHPLIPGLFV